MSDALPKPDFIGVERLINDDMKNLNNKIHYTILGHCVSKCFNDFKTTDMSSTERKCLDNCLLNNLENLNAQNLK